MLPARVLRLMMGGVFGIATLVAVAMTAGGGSRIPLLITATAWGLYGIAVTIFDAIDRVPDAVASLLTNVGLTRYPPGFSEIETLVAQGHYAAAAESYRYRAGRAAERVEATVRRGWLLAGPLHAPHQAIQELEALRHGAPLTPADDVRVGLALSDLHERAGEPGRALVEYRRLLDRHPDSPYAPQVRVRLTHLRQDRFSDAERTT